MRSGLLLLLACAGLAHARGAGVDGSRARPAPIDSGYVREVGLEPPPGSVLRHYRLDLPGAPAARVPLGVVRWVCGRVGDEGALRSEVETSFPGIGTRVIHVEALGAGEGKLVWREVRERSGRTVLAQREAGLGLRTAETLGRDVQRASSALPPEALFPLELVEALRVGRARAGPLVLYEPLANELARLELRLRPLPAPLPLRLASLVRSDGASAGAFVFAGGELLSFRGQGGGPVATPISAEEFARLIAPSSSPGE